MERPALSATMYVALRYTTTRAQASGPRTQSSLLSSSKTPPIRFTTAEHAHQACEAESYGGFLLLWRARGTGAALLDPSTPGACSGLDAIDRVLPQFESKISTKALYLLGRRPRVIATGFVSTAVSADKGPRTGNELPKFFIAKFTERYFAAFRTARTM